MEEQKAEKSKPTDERLEKMRERYRAHKERERVARERSSLILDAAIKYLEEGCSVVPIGLGDKDPSSVLREWNPYKERPPTEEEVRGWFTNTTHQIGMPLGWVSGGHFVLDFDGPYWEGPYQEFLEVFPEFKNTRRAKTGSGKIHLHGCWPEMPKTQGKVTGRIDPGTFEIKDGKRVRTEKETKIELLAQGEQALVPPSQHPDGGFYEWEVDGPVALVTEERFKEIVAYLEKITKETEPLFKAANAKAKAKGDSKTDDPKKDSNGHKVNDIPIRDVAERLRMKEEFGLDQAQYDHGECPTGHPSENGKCFSLNRDENYWHCFDCEKAGGVISLVRAVKACSYGNAVKWLELEFPEYREGNPQVNIDSRGLIELLEEPDEEPDYLAKPILVAGDKGYLIGPYKVGKTLLLICLTLALSKGVAFLNFEVPKPRKVLYVRFELSEKKFKRNVKMLMMGVSPTTALEKEPRFCLRRGFNLLDQKDFDWLVGQIDKYEPELLNLDPLYKLTNLELAKPEATVPLIRAYEKLRMRYEKLCILTAHHPIKQTGLRKSTSWDTAYGGMQLLADMDFALRIDEVRQEGKNEKVFKLEYITNADPIDPIFMRRDPSSLVYLMTDGPKKKKTVKQENKGEDESKDKMRQALMRHYDETGKFMAKMEFKKYSREQLKIPDRKFDELFKEGEKIFWRIKEQGKEKLCMPMADGEKDGQ